MGALLYVAWKSTEFDGYLSRRSRRRLVDARGVVIFVAMLVFPTAATAVFTEIVMEQVRNRDELIREIFIEPILEDFGPTMTTILTNEP